jgi:hypothetical protein
VNAQPLLNSRPGSSKVLLLVTQGTAGYGPAGLNYDQITNVWRSVSENFIAFDVNVTTDVNVYNNTPWNKKTRVILTQTGYNGNSCGWSYVGVFGMGSDCVAYCYNDLWGWNSVSHELGHNIALNHQHTYDAATCSNYISEYSLGCEKDGENQYRPIMGGNGSTMMRWTNGYDPCTGCTQGQNDMQAIANVVGAVPDDFADTEAEASDITFITKPLDCFVNCTEQAPGWINNNFKQDAILGLINYKGVDVTDIDYFKLNFTANSTRAISVKIFEDGFTRVSSLNLILKIYKAGEEAAATWITNASRNIPSFNYQFTPGTYYVAVSVAPYPVDQNDTKFVPTAGQLGRYWLQLAP